MLRLRVLVRPHECPAAWPLNLSPNKAKRAASGSDTIDVIETEIERAGSVSVRNLVRRLRQSD